MKVAGTLFAAFVTLSISSAALADTPLLTLTDPPGTTTPYTLSFLAGSPTTTISFGGYQFYSFEDVTNIRLVLSGSSTNLLGQTFNFTSSGAGCGSNFSSQSGPGAYNTNNLVFGSFCIGSYDLFSQTVNTTSGSQYDLSFTFANDPVAPAPSGFQVTASNATPVQGVPEPASWAMMLIGFGAAGAMLRFRHKRTMTSRV